jgi:hypothetical protein
LLQNQQPLLLNSLAKLKGWKKKTRTWFS